MQRTPRLPLGSRPDVDGAGSLIRDVRRAGRMVVGGFEQKETKRTKGRPTSLFPSLSSVDLGCVTRLGADFPFRVFRVFRGYIPTVLIPAGRERSWRFNAIKG